jgi:cytochrome c5
LNIRLAALLCLCLGLALASRGALAATTAESYMRNCAVCHLPGIADAPKVGDKAEWSRRMRSGLSMVYRNALEGLPNTAMMAKGGHTDLSDEEIKAIVDYMIGAAALDRETLEAAARYDRHGITDRAFVRLDRNFDGSLGRDELAHDAVLLQAFARFDANRDGRLSEAEYRSAEATLDRERASVTVADDALIAAVRAALGKVRGVDLPNTKIESDKGVVAIVGIVENAEVARQANDLVKRIRGVKVIDNRLISGHQMGWD